MAIVVRIVATLALGMALGDVKVVEKRDSAGRLSVRSEMREASGGEFVKNGTETTFSPDGSIASQFEYSNGVLDGPWKKWYAPGHLQAEGEYRHGKKEGLAVRVCRQWRQA